MALFGTSGIRRVISRDLLRLAFDVGLALSKHYDNVVIGRDTRTSGMALKHAITAGIVSGGARCSDAGIIPTPTLAFAAVNFRAGVMLTASHNPPEYNGIKLINPDGSAFSEEQQNQIEEDIQKQSADITRWNDFGNDELYTEATLQHAHNIIERFKSRFKVRVVVDCGGGAAYHITPYILNKLGCEVIMLNCEATGIFPHDVEPIDANLGDLKKAVSDHHADLGIAHDGDADRMMAVDDRGRFIPGDKMLAILAKASRGRKIVTTIDASMTIEEMGFKTIRTRVGDPYVSEAVKRNSCRFGGEPSGAWIFPDISYCPDGIYAAARIVSIASKVKLSEMVDTIPSYPLVRGSIKGDLKIMEQLEKNISLLSPDIIERTDGIKIGYSDGWVLIRPSGTELKIRITVEAKSRERAQALYNAIVKFIGQIAA